MFKRKRRLELEKVKIKNRDEFIKNQERQLNLLKQQNQLLTEENMALYRENKELQLENEILYNQIKKAIYLVEINRYGNDKVVLSKVGELLKELF